MKAFTTIATVAALASTTYAATVTLEETPCLQPQPNLETFTIELGKLVEKELKSVCGLKINSATDADVNSISCTAFKDKEGKEVGSAVFTFKEPARIATNPVQEGSIWCNVNGTTSSGGGPAQTSAGTALPTPNGGGNLTNPSQTPTVAPSQTPSGTAAGAPEGSGAAGRAGLSVGAAIAGFAVFLL